MDQKPYVVQQKEKRRRIICTEPSAALAKLSDEVNH
jgi:hypothetical protein